MSGIARPRRWIQRVGRAMLASLAALFALSLVALTPGAISAQELTAMLFHPTQLGEAWRGAELVAREFERAHPGVTVKLIPEGPGDVLTKLRILLAARQPLDVAIVDVVEFSSFLADGALLDLTPHLAADPAFDESAFYPLCLDAFRDRAGRLYGLPSTFTPYVMYYNQDIFDAHGIAYPTAAWTWDDLLSICERTSAPPERYGISLTQWLQALAPWVWQAGGRFLDEDTGVTRSAMREPATVRAFQFLADLFHRHRVASSDATYEGQLARGLFQDGRVALYGPVGYWELYKFRAIDAFRWDVCPLPRGERGATSIAMRSYVGFAHTEHPELVAAFIRALAGEGLSRTLAEIGNGVPGLRAVAESDAFLRPDAPPASERVFLDVIPEARFLPVFANWRELEAAVKEELHDLLVLGKIDAETACARMDGEIEAILARERAERARPRAPVRALLGATALLAAALAGGAWLRLRRGPRPSARARRRERAALGFLLPWGIGFALFLLGPMLASLALSFTDWSPVRDLSEARWAGLGNYRRMLADGDFRAAVEVTSLYALASVPATLALALALALLVRRGRDLFRTVFYLPMVVSAVSAGLVWRWIYDSAVVERLIGARWIESEAWILPGFVGMSLWSVGGAMLVFLAGLQGIDPTLYEAARLDGASRARQFLHVTMPQLGPVLLFNLVMGIIGASQTFAQPYVMTQGGPGNASLFYVLHLFREAFRFHHMGYASALGWVLFLALLGLTIGLLAASRRWVHYEGGTP